MTFTVTDDSGNAAIATTSLTVNDVDFVVTTLDDELDADPESDLSDLSLREAISLANANVGPDSIRFDLTLSGTVLLDAALGELEISDSLTLIGLGRDMTTIDGQDKSRVIVITDAAGDVTIDSLTITGGRLVSDFEGGAGIRCESLGTLTISQSTIANNTASGEGGVGAGIQATAGDLVITDTIFLGQPSGGSFRGWRGHLDRGRQRDDSAKYLYGQQHRRKLGRGRRFVRAERKRQRSRPVLLATTSRSRVNPVGGAIALLNANATIIDSTIAGNSTAGTESPGGGIHTSLIAAEVGQ